MRSVRGKLRNLCAYGGLATILASLRSRGISLEDELAPPRSLVLPDAIALSDRPQLSIEEQQALKRLGFLPVYDSARRIPRCVVQRLHADGLHKNAKRS